MSLNVPEASGLTVLKIRNTRLNTCTLYRKRFLTLVRKKKYTHYSHHRISMLQDKRCNGKYDQLTKCWRSVVFLYGLCFPIFGDNILHSKCYWLKLYTAYSTNTSHFIPYQRQTDHFTLISWWQNPHITLLFWYIKSHLTAFESFITWFLMI